VVPKSHYENLYDLEEPAGLDIHRLTRTIAIALKEAFGCDGHVDPASTRQHNEPAGNQDLWHLHVHVFPRFDGDDLYGSWYRESTYEERLEFAARLQSGL
jgi:histidine triad (HIT) family protein